MTCILEIKQVVLGVPIIFAGCSSTEKNEDTVTQSVVASDFVFEVITPTIIVTGEAIKVKGTLKYTGIKPVEISHGEPIIRFFFWGSHFVNYRCNFH
ncbi:hypothetical protein SAMN05518856_104232 [Paenibacillus sp. OK003]|nr:hypothetical protein SAMN05518856_104232 [Paenibacillus sp. OK003]